MHEDLVGLRLSDIDPPLWVGMWVTYHGNRRIARLGFGQRFKVVEQRSDNGSVGFDAGGPNLEWASPAYLRIVDVPRDTATGLTTEQAEEILNPHAGTIESLDAEIKRLRERLAELTAARQVIAGL